MSQKLRHRILEIHNEYLKYRVGGVPFPPESVAFWCFMLALQEAMSVCGDFLEIGVEHGGTAFLCACALGESERQVLIDLKKTSQFEDKFSLLRPSVADRITFYEMNVKKFPLDVLKGRKTRWIHIDGGHEYEDVVRDIDTFSTLVDQNTILVMDDVFEIRWPGVTEAVLERFPLLGLAPIALVNRKFYFARKADAPLYHERIRQNADVLGVFGDLRHWQVQLRGMPCEALKLGLKRRVAVEAIPD